MAVKVQFQIGHTSKLRSKKTVEGFTHDWELYVKGVQQADISAFVEKIIFNLHESFQKPKRVCKEPPYIIQESGYAGFIVFIDIYFRNRDEPKKVEFSYDLDLQQTGPPKHRYDIKTFIFDNPSEEYRLKLLKGGGVPVSGVVRGSSPAINNNTGAVTVPTSLNHSPGDGHKNVIAEGKKHKSRPDDSRSNSFANLFGPPITKTTAVSTTVPNKHSPDNKATAGGHQTSAGVGLPVVKEKSSKDKDKSSEKSKDRSEKKDKHHKQSLTSPHKEGRSESKKSDGSKHEKRDKTEEKSKKDKNRDKDRERDRDKSTAANVNNSSSNSKRPSSPKSGREHSPHKSGAVGGPLPSALTNNANSIPRPSSSNSGKIDDLKTSSKSSKDSTGEGKSKESKQKESSSSSSGKKSKKEKKDKDKERDKEKRHEEKEKQKLAESQQRSAKDDKTNGQPIINQSNPNSLDNKNSKSSISSINNNAGHTNDVIKKQEKLSKQDLFKNNEKATLNSSTPTVPVNNTTANTSNDKKTSSGSTVNSNSNPPEKDKRSHKHKKKEKNKDKDKDRERDKERDKDKDKERDKDKDKEKENKKEKEVKEKHHEEKSTDSLTSIQISNSAKGTSTPTASTTAVNTTEETPNQSTTLTVPSNASSSGAAVAPITSTAISSSSSSSKSSKNKEKKSKDKSSKEEKLKHKSNEADGGETKAKQAKLNNNSSMPTPSLSASSSSSRVSTAIANSTTSTLSAPSITSTAVSEATLNLDLSDTDSLPAASVESVTPLPNNSATKPSLQPPPNVTHSDSSNSSFPDLSLPKQQTLQKSGTSQDQVKPVAASSHGTLVKEPQKQNSKNSKDKLMEKPSKEEEKEKKRRRNSQAVNTFIEPPLKQLKKEQTKSVREKSKSPSLRNTGSRASISAEASTTFLQPSASPSSTAAAAPLPPPSNTPSAAHSPALSATEAVGNATSATANAATCNSNTTPSSTTNSSVLAPHQLPLDYLSELQELHHKIMTLQDNEDLQHVVELIAATGCYEITTKTFDFDLCKLDRPTVKRLQEFFATSVS